MKLSADYQAYQAALRDVLELPRDEASELDAIERRARGEIEKLGRIRRDAAEQWVGLRDDSSRLHRKIDDLARRVGAPSNMSDAADVLPAAALSRALEGLRSDLEAADQAWQWLLRHRERSVTPVYTPPLAPAVPLYSAPPAPVPVSERPSSSINPTVLLAIAAAVIVVLVIVVILMAF